MRPRRILTLHEAAEIIDSAVRDNALAILTLQEPRGWITFKGRFLERDPNRKFIVLDNQALPGDKPLPELSQGQYIGLSFRHRSRKVLCATVVEARGKFLVDGSAAVPAVRYRWPDALMELQRRAYYRTPVPPGTHLTASIWPGGIAFRDEAQTRSIEVYAGHAMDLSCGGTLVHVQQGAAPSWAIDQTLGVELHLPDGRPPVLLDAYFRGARSDSDGTQYIAVQFVGLELSADGRGLLQRLTRCLQKFHRLLMVGETRSGAARFRAP
jgi:c-di-GMP-binding flagellar brake protein YcgR